MFRILLIGLTAVAAAGFAWAHPQEQGTAPVDSLKVPSKEEATSEHVKRALFTTAVSDREPADQVTTLKTEMDHVFFFTEIVGMEGKSLVHRWLHDGEMKAEVQFQIGGQRWRVYSSKTLTPGSSGRWTVEVLDAEGNKLHAAHVDYETTP